MRWIIKREQLVVETKKIRKDLTATEIGEERIVDIAKFRVHPSCNALFCFVHDPKGRISNPAALTADLSRSRDEIRVEVQIAPPL